MPVLTARFPLENQREKETFENVALGIGRRRRHVKEQLTLCDWGEMSSLREMRRRFIVPRFNCNWKHKKCGQQKKKKQLPAGSSRQEQLMIVSNIRPPSSSSIPYGFKNTRVTKRETAELCNQPTDYTFPVMMIPVDITRGCSLLMEPNTHTHDDDDDVLYMSTHIHTGAMTCSSFSRNFFVK